jgi:transposase
MRQLRKECVCTSTTLQGVLAKERKVKVSAGHVRNVLLKSGYRWLRRSQKRQDQSCTPGLCQAGSEDVRGSAA